MVNPMNSPFANIIIDLQKYIHTIVPSIRYIDLDYGQLESVERPQVDFPCLLIDFITTNFEETGAGVQTAQGAIMFKLATDPYSATSSITSDIWIKDGLSILDLEWLLYKALNGYKPITEYDTDGNPIRQAQPMVRASATSDNRRPGIKVRQFMYTASFIDYSAKRPYPTAPATPNITDAIDTTIPQSSPAQTVSIKL
jgi:hypothetical protein